MTGEITFNGFGELNKLIDSVCKVIKDSKNDFARDTIDLTKARLKAYAPKGIRQRQALGQSIIGMKYKNKAAGWVGWNTNKNEMIALLNEVGLKKPMLLPVNLDPLLKRWVDAKIPNYNKPFITIGGKNTRLGRQNIFIAPALADVDKSVEQVITSRIAVNLQKCKTI